MPRAIQSTALELERQRAADSLRKGLEKRPEREELIERGFPFRATLHSLREGVVHGNLANQLGILFLIGNILPDSTAAPALQGHQRELEKHMRADSLEHKIQQRPKAEDLIKEGILVPEEDPPTNK